MPKQTKTKKPGPKLARSETVSVRLDPRLRYLTEIAARKQRRTISSYIEWAIEHSFGYIKMLPRECSLMECADGLWDYDKINRFLCLAGMFPGLLTNEEQAIFNVINGHKIFHTTLGTSHVRNIKHNWDKICAVARGEERTKDFVAEKEISNE